MSKTIYRHIRLSHNFENIQRINGIKILRIPCHLLKEKQRTQARFEVIHVGSGVALRMLFKLRLHKKRPAFDSQKRSDSTFALYGISCGVAPLMLSKTKRNRTRAGSDSVAQPKTSGRHALPRRQRELNRSVVERTRSRLNSFWQDDVPWILDQHVAGATSMAPRIYVHVHDFLNQVARDLHSIYPSTAAQPEQVLQDLGEALRGLQA